jgi:ABC-type uncharacterized transport system involved in gliding motility auxiliary subunit
VGILELALTPNVPEDCTLLIVAGPQKGFPEADVKAIQAYLERPGKALFLVDPNPPEGLERVLAGWGIGLGKGRVVDEGAFVSPDKKTPAVPRGAYPPLVVTRGLDSTYFPEAAPVVVSDLLTRGDKGTVRWPEGAVGDDSLAVLPLAVTTPMSWLETDPAADRYDEGVDTRGPLALGCLVMGSSPVGGAKPARGSSGKLTRLAVVGDSDFATNQHYRNGGNSDLFLNAVSWLTEEEHLISIRPKPFAFRRLVIGEDASRFIRYSSVALLPLAVLLAGGIVWWRRR